MNQPWFNYTKVVPSQLKVGHLHRSSHMFSKDIEAEIAQSEKASPKEKLKTHLASTQNHRAVEIVLKPVEIVLKTSSLRKDSNGLANPL